MFLWVLRREIPSQGTCEAPPCARSCESAGKRAAARTDRDCGASARSRSPAASRDWPPVAQPESRSMCVVLRHAGKVPAMWSGPRWTARRRKALGPPTASCMPAGWSWTRRLGSPSAGARQRSTSSPCARKATDRCSCPTTPTAASTASRAVAPPQRSAGGASRGRERRACAGRKSARALNGRPRSRRESTIVHRPRRLLNL
jgi:hypothetical protein